MKDLQNDVNEIAEKILKERFSSMNESRKLASHRKKSFRKFNNNFINNLKDNKSKIEKIKDSINSTKI